MIKDSIEKFVKQLSAVINTKNKERMKITSSSSMLYDYNPFVFDAIKNANVFMNFEENEDEGRNYSHILNQICYFADVNQIEIIDEAGKPEVREYLVDFYEYFESVRSYNRNMDTIDTGEFVSIWFYLEDLIKEDQLEIDNFCDLVVAKMNEVRNYIYVRPLYASKTVQMLLTFIDILISYYPRFSVDS